MSDSKTRTMKVMYPKESDLQKIAVDQIGLYAHLYSELFGKQFKRDQKSKPWRRGILVVERQLANGEMRRLRLLFRSGAFTGVGNDTCLIGAMARSQLGIEAEGEEVQIRVENQWISRALFYWNHPLDGTRVAFKLGSVALLIALSQIIIGIFT